MEQTHTAQQGACAACGTSPVNHTLTYAATVVDDILASTMGVMFSWIRIPREGTISNMVSAGFVGFFRIFGLAKFSEDRTKAVSGRSEMIWEEAHRRGIKMQQIVMFGKPLEQYRARLGGKWFYFQSIPVPYWLPQRGYEWVDDKFKLGKRLSEAGIRAPKVEHVRTWKKAERVFAQMEKPVIVKPRAGSRARHTTTNIRTLADLRKAYDLACMIAPSLVIEEHLFGSVYRATVVDNKLVGFFRGDPPKATGDGVHTVRELIAEKNAHRNEKLNEIRITDDMTSFIGRYGYTLLSVLPKGTVLDLSAKSGRFYGGYTKEMLPEVHPKMHEIFRKAGIAVEASIVGFDLIIPDPAADPDTQTWGIIECNSLPFIDLHYFALEGEPVDIAKNIWDLWEAKLGPAAKK